MILPPAIGCQEQPLFGRSFRRANGIALSRGVHCRSAADFGSMGERLWSQLDFDRSSGLVLSEGQR